LELFYRLVGQDEIVMRKVFVCHSSLDKPFVRRLCIELERHGVSVWLDEREIRVGESLVQRVETGLEQCEYVIVALSRAALESEWVRKELNAAFSLEIYRKSVVILPVLIEPAKLPLFLLDKKYADFSKNWTEGLGELLTALGAQAVPSTDVNLETLSCRVTLDILSSDGRLVNYEKKQIVICRRGTEAGYTEAFTADGELSNFTIKPGIIEKQWKESGVTYIRTLFPNPLKEGEQADRTFSFNMQNAFVSTEEYWEEKQHHPSKNVELVVIFPNDRAPKSCSVVERIGSVVATSKYETENILVGTRPALRLFLVSPKLLVNYIMRWTW